jgi:tetratricopeptide (TPR) repeat protein
VGVRDTAKLRVMAIGVVGLAGALTAAAFLAPNRAAAAATTYLPRDEGDVVARVPVRDRAEIAERAALAAAPDRVELAVAIARAEIGRARRLSDPRYLGRAQATLARWWGMERPPEDVLLLRATIEQSLHDFHAARADLDQLIARRPDDAQAHLTRAVVATVTADYAAARQSCDAVAQLAPPLVALACRAPLDALQGDADKAYAELAAALDGGTASSAARVPRRSDPALREWALTTLAELAIQRGDEALAGTHLERALAIDPDDAYARAALADVLLERQDPAAASALLAGYENIDNLLVRRAIAETRAYGPEAAALTQKMHERIMAAAERGDRVHMREEAMFVLAVDVDAPRALAIAQKNWGVQKELADARLLAQAAAAAREPEAAQPVIEWARATGVHDARLAHALEGL